MSMSVKLLQYMNPTIGFGPSHRHGSVIELSAVLKALEVIN